MLDRTGRAAAASADGWHERADRARSAPRPAGADIAETSFVRSLDVHGDAVAIRRPDGSHLTYGDLSRRVAEAAEVLGTQRRLVVVRAANDVDTLVGYLAALHGGHPALVVPPRALDDLVAGYDPDAVVVATGDGDPIRLRRRGTAHDLHPDLALVLSTSGSTGVAKAVRLSRRNVEANAAAIAGYLRIGPDDLAATTLPLAYCYGLSVIHSHLLAGAGLLLGDTSVTDPDFWERFADEGATSFAGVPHTFSLLERVGFEAMDLPTLRCVTQAGGRLAPQRVRHLAGLGRSKGWRFVVMYGQTEATARMAYLPPERAESHADSIGIPIPGGSFRIEPVEGCAPGEGELVYRGPNVMMGYAEAPADLALGPTLDELRTGDLGRCDDGIYRVTGRRSRFVKPYGLRIDLDRAEALLAGAGFEAYCTGDDHHLAVGVRCPIDPTRPTPGGPAWPAPLDRRGRPGAPGGRRARPPASGRANHDARPASLTAVDEAARWLAATLGLPPGTVRAAAFAELPLLANGKPDLAAVRTAVDERHRPRNGSGPPDPPGNAGGGQPAGAVGRSTSDELSAVYERLLAREVGPDDSFVSLGGDSLTYVEASIRVEALLGHLPPGWHELPVAELAELPRRGPRSLRTMETGVVVRAVAIVAVVLTHLHLIDASGGAHLLLAVVGYNVARFQINGRADVASSLRTAIARVAVPSLVWIGFQVAVDDRHRVANLFLVENYLADGTWRYWYWFIEVVVQVLVVVAVAFSLPRVASLERRSPFAFAGVAFLGSLALATIPFGNPDNDIFRTHSVAWLIVLGWLVQRADTTRRRILVTAVAAVATVLLLGAEGRGLVVVGGLVLLAWLPQLSVPSLVHPVLARLAGASLAIYLTHWMVLDLLWGHASAEVTAVVAIAVGLAAARLITLASAATATFRSRATSPRSPGAMARGHEG